MLGLRAALLALTIIAQPTQVDQIAAYVRALPACVQNSLNEQVRAVVITDSWVLGKTFDGVATEDGIIILVNTPDDTLRLELLHELGHEVADVAGISDEFKRSLKADFEAMTPHQRQALRYYRTPAEAFAELFAERYDPEYATEGEPDLKYLVLARRAFNLEMERLPECRALK